MHRTRWACSQGPAEVNKLSHLRLGLAWCADRFAPCNTRYRWVPASLHTEELWVQLSKACSLFHTFKQQRGGRDCLLSVGQSKLAVDCPDPGLRTKESHDGCQSWLVLRGSLSDGTPPHRCRTQGLFIATVEKQTVQCILTACRPLVGHTGV